MKPRVVPRPQTQHGSTETELGASASGVSRIVALAQRQVQTFFDELKNGTENYRTVASLGGQIAQEYRGRCIQELLQNAHDALSHARKGDPRRISFVLTRAPNPVLLVGNSGRPFLSEDFKGICQLGQSPKNPNESVGNKGLGFRSVLQVCTCPEIWSSAPDGIGPAFLFRFDPVLSDMVARAAEELERKGLDARSPFDQELPLLDWSPEQLSQYFARLSAGLDGANEVRAFLSPYLLPLPIEGGCAEVEKLLEAGHSTVIRLRLDGGATGDPAGAVQTVLDQLDALDARSTIFLPHLEVLEIEVDGDRRVLERVVEWDGEFSASERIRAQQLLVGCSRSTSEDSATSRFRVWTRSLGGDDHPVQAERILASVKHLPNRWPEVRRVTVGVAVEEAATAEEGVFVIFLPTEMTTGTGAHFNAPFYGSLDRRHINFGDPYNELLLQAVLDLCLDVAGGLVFGPTEDWRAWAAVDLLASTATVGGAAWQFMDRLAERAAARGNSLGELRSVLCDAGWTIPGSARAMPAVPEDCPIDLAHWRKNAAFDVVSTVLDGRRAAVQQMVRKFGGVLDPTSEEWRNTLQQVAARVHAGEIEASWDGFMNSVVEVLPQSLLSAQRRGTADPLAAARFLPAQDGRLLSASDSASLFFQPVRGADDAAELVGDVPRSLGDRVAFLHPDVRTQEGPQRRNTAVHKFLEDRFARGFRREDLLRDVVAGAVPRLPALHGSPEGVLCGELFAWTLKLIGNEESDTLLHLLGRLPVACHGGWFAIDNAVFGPGWEGRLGDRLWVLADGLPADLATRLREAALLPPDDERWGVSVSGREGLFARAGVFDGLRLLPAPDVRFQMQGHGLHSLPRQPPVGTPTPDWDAWRAAVHAEAKPGYDGLFEYTLSGITLLPELYNHKTLNGAARQALAELILGSITQWPDGWQTVRLSKAEGNQWSRRIKSPLRHWLTTVAWLSDQGVERVLSDRWLVPESLLVDQPDRFAHLDPLSARIARRLRTDAALKSALCALGLNVYPEEDDKIGPGLLDALANSWASGKVPPQRFDVFLGQVREAWRHFDTATPLPKAFLVTTGRRAFSTLGRDDLSDIYLPDNRVRTQSLREHGKHILEMHTADAGRVANTLLSATKIRRASALDERVLVDGELWTGTPVGIPSLDESRFAWLPTPILAVAAHGGARPTGASTRAWREAAEALKRAGILECESISVQLVDNEEVVASSEPAAQWLTGNVLAVRRDTELSYETLAPAAQAILGRQDLLKDLRLVLGSLAGRPDPTPEQIETALERAEIDAQTLADVRHHWAGNTSFVVDRIRPVLALLGISSVGLEAAATDPERLTEWLTLNLPQWPTQDALVAARRSPDDRAMGEAAWRALGKDAELPAWNRALAELGERYAAVANRGAANQVAAHLDEATPYLRAFARYVAVAADNPALFHAMESVTTSFVVPDEWSTTWWEVPFMAVLGALRAGYAAIPVAEKELEVLGEAASIESLGLAFKARGISIDPSPYETAALNRDHLAEILARVHELHRAWLELHNLPPVAADPPRLPSELAAAAYLRAWTEAELIAMVLGIIDDAEFTAACHGCASQNQIRDRLGLDSTVIDAQREERLRREQEFERRGRTFNVAGESFEVGTNSYANLFERLCGLPAPAGPRASQDRLTPLGNANPGGGTAGGGPGGLKTSHRRPSPALRELVGVVGEVHAYRFLRTEFGTDTVTRDAWVSELRLKVLPLVPGEADPTSDGYGFDFKFRHRGKLWHVEVKATQGDEPQFDLGISEIEAASRLARVKDGRWRILRVCNALTEHPTFEWLPNPFEEGFRKHFRLRKGGMMVSYARSS